MKNEDMPWEDTMQTEEHSSSDHMIYSYEANLMDKPYPMGGEELIEVTPVYRSAKDYDGTSFENVSTADIERDIFANSKGYQNSKGESCVTVDDDRRIADMNVEGMPWHVKLPDEEERLKRLQEPTLTGKETRRLIVNALLASLMVAAVFGIGIFAFIMFCIKVWFA